jgi:hypothetical protein
VPIDKENSCIHKLYQYRIWIDDDVVQKIRFDRDPRDPVCDDGAWCYVLCTFEYYHR